MFCRKVQGMGTVIAKRECHPKSEWARQTRVSREAAKMQQGEGYFGAKPPN